MGKYSARRGVMDTVTGECFKDKVVNNECLVLLRHPFCFHKMEVSLVILVMVSVELYG